MTVKRVVERVAHQVAGRVGSAGDPRGRCGLERVEDGEGRVEPLLRRRVVDAHLPGQRPPGHVVGRDRRAARIREVVRVVLRLEHVEHVRPERLVRLHDVRARRIAVGADAHLGGGLAHLDARLDERVHELDRGREVGLVGRDDVAARVTVRRIVEHLLVQLGGRGEAAAHAHPVRQVRRRLLHRGDPVRRGRPGVAPPPLDLPAPLAPHVEEQPLAVLRRVVEHGAVELHLVVDRLPVVPRLRRHGRGQVAVRQLHRRHEGELDRRGVADDLGEQPDHVVEVHDRAQPAVPPRGVVREAALAGARHPALDQTRVHGRAHLLDLEGDERVEVVVEGVAEGRHEDHAAGLPEARLVVVVDDLWKPLPEHDPVHVRGLRHVRHEEVAVVVVTHVLVVDAGQVVQRARLLVRLAHVPVRDDLLAVGVGLHGEQDHVVEEAQGLLVRARHHLPHQLHELLRAHRLRRVQATVDPDDRLAVLREGARLLLAQPLGARKAGRDLPVVVEARLVLGRGHDRHVLATALGGGPDVRELHARGLVGQLLPPCLELRVGGHVVVGAELEAERLARRGEARLLRRDRSTRQADQEKNEGKGTSGSDDRASAHGKGPLPLGKRRAGGGQSDGLPVGHDPVEIGRAPSRRKRRRAGPGAGYSAEASALVRPGLEVPRWAGDPLSALGARRDARRTHPGMRALIRTT